MGVPNKDWRQSTINVDYSVCPTYPGTLYVPYLALHNRLPRLPWHPVRTIPCFAQSPILPWHPVRIIPCFAQSPILPWHPVRIIPLRPLLPCLPYHLPGHAVRTIPCFAHLPRLPGHAVYVQVRTTEHHGRAAAWCVHVPEPGQVRGIPCFAHMRPRPGAREGGSRP